MGFCLFNNIAIAARHLLKSHGLERVLILDWDVHHGNGTQHSFDDDPRVFFCSLHGHPDSLYPGTGYAHERGSGAGEGTTLNLPMQPGAGDAEYRAAFCEHVLPAARAYRPEFILISAGFDAHRADPLAPIELETSSFEWMTEEVRALADECCGGRLVSMLEGGYNLDALGESAAVHLRCLMSRFFVSLHGHPDALYPGTGYAHREFALRVMARRPNDTEGIVELARDNRINRPNHRPAGQSGDLEGLRANSQSRINTRSMPCDFSKWRAATAMLLNRQKPIENSRSA